MEASHCERGAYQARMIEGNAESCATARTTVTCPMHAVWSIVPKWLLPGLMKSNRRPPTCAMVIGPERFEHSEAAQIRHQIGALQGLIRCLKLQGWESASLHLRPDVCLSFLLWFRSASSYIQLPAPGVYSPCLDHGASHNDQCPT